MIDLTLPVFTRIYRGMQTSSRFRLFNIPIEELLQSADRPTSSKGPIGIARFDREAQMRRLAANFPNPQTDCDEISIGIADSSYRKVLW
jgi:hypothetical protein